MRAKFVYESLNDIFKPKSYEEINKNLSTLSKNERILQLMYNSRDGNLEIVKTLIENGLDINSKLYDGNTPLMAACRNIHFDVAEFLLKNGADVNAKNIYKYTALEYLLEIMDNESNTNNIFKLINLLKNYGAK